MPSFWAGNRTLFFFFFSFLLFFSRTSSLLCSQLRTRSTHRLSLQYLAVIPTPIIIITELVPAVFSVHNHEFCGGASTFFQELNTRVFILIELRMINSWISNKIMTKFTNYL